MDVSVLIVNFRCWDKLSDCLNALLEPNNELALEIIVVDNCSSDGKLDAFASRFPKVNFIENTGNNGFANGCNRAADAATGDTLLFLNPDTLMQPSAIKALLAVKTKHPAIGMLSCRQLDGKGRNQKAFGYFDSFWTTFGITRALVQKLFPSRFPSARADLETLTECDWISGSVVMISRQHYDQLGGWDDGFWMYSEDMDLSKRCWDAGLNVAYEPNVTITHLHGGASRSSSETKALTKAEVIISKHYFAHKHDSGSQLLVFIQRSLPALLLGFLLLPSKLGKDSHYAVKRARHLIDFYRLWLQTKQPISPRSVKRHTR